MPVITNEEILFFEDETDALLSPGLSAGTCHPQCIEVLGQKMAQNLNLEPENGTKFVPKHQMTEPPLLLGWRSQRMLSEFVRTILGLSADENSVLNTILQFQMPKRASVIAKTAGVNRKRTNRILRAFAVRKLVIVFSKKGREDRFRYNTKLSSLKSKGFWTPSVPSSAHHQTPSQLRHPKL